MTSGQAWVIIAELALFNVILAVIVIVTLMQGLRHKE
jgi:hypothetical protein